MTDRDTHPQDNTSEFLKGEFKRRAPLFDESVPGSSVWSTLFSLYSTGRITKHEYQVLTDMNSEWDETPIHYITNLKKLKLVTPDEYNVYMCSQYTGW